MMLHACRQLRLSNVAPLHIIPLKREERRLRERFLPRRPGRIARTAHTVSHSASLSSHNGNCGDWFGVANSRGSATVSGSTRDGATRAVGGCHGRQSPR
jgi:hypothetical protein